MLILNHISYSYVNYFNGDVGHVRKLLETNFLSYIAMTTYALPMLKESEGNIVVVSSVAGEHATGQALLARDPCCSSPSKDRIRAIGQRTTLLGVRVSLWFIPWMHSSSPLGDLYAMPCPASVSTPTNHLHELQSMACHARCA